MIAHISCTGWDIFRTYRSISNIKKNNILESNVVQYISGNEKRIIQYRVLLNYVTSAYAKLSNRSLQKDTFDLIDDLALFICSYDDLMDNHGLQHSEIIQMVEAERDDTRYPELSAVRFFYQEIHQKHSNVERLKELIIKGGNAQDVGLHATKDTDLDVLFESMISKGGYAVLAPMTAIASLNALDEQIIFQLGGLMQFLNDVLDVRKDSINEDVTFVLASPSLESVHEEYNKQLDRLKTQLNASDYQNRRCEYFWIRLNFLFEIGNMALCQYINASKKYSNYKDILGMKRQEIVIDMGKLKNKVRLFWNTVRK